MMPLPRRAQAVAVLVLLASAGTAVSADIAPHRARYNMSLGSAKAGSGVVGASGSMSFEWGEACDGWTVEQRYKLALRYSDEPDVELTSSFVTWESKDGLRYRFYQRKLKNGDLEDEVRGEARLEGKGQGGEADFTKPETTSMELAPGVIFPTAHTLLLLERAAAGDQFVAAKVFDGATEDNAVDVSAVIGGAQGAESAGGPISSPLLARPSWRMRLAFFPAEAQGDQPDYELGMRLLDNGISRDMVLDYGDFAIKAILDELEPLPKPSC
jgi:hypothetical protein